MKNNTISILRVSAMLCVVFIHIFEYYEFIPFPTVIAQVLLFANPLFFSYLAIYLAER